MGGVVKFEELNIWQEARRIVKEIYQNTASIKDMGFNEQIQRAAISIMNNIAEGFESGSNPMFKRFLCISKGSCGEVKSMLYIAKDLNYTSEEKSELLLQDCQGLSVAINKFIHYMQQHPTH